MGKKDELFKFAQILQSTVDKGIKEDVGIILKQCENSGIATYLREKYPDVNFDWATKLDDTIINDFFADTGLVDKNDVGRKYMIENNGLCFLIAYIVEELRGDIQYLN